MEMVVVVLVVVVVCCSVRGVMEEVCGRMCSELDNCEHVRVCMRELIDSDVRRSMLARTRALQALHKKIACTAWPNK